MEHNDLLDDKDDDNLILGMVQWWEKRRLRYNLIVGGVGVLVIIFISTMIYGLLSHSEDILIIVFFYGLFANIAYLLGWVLEILLRYYFNIMLGEQSRNVLYWLGVFVSVLPILGVLMGVSSAI